MNCSKFIGDCGSCIANYCYHYVMFNGSVFCVDNPKKVIGLVDLKVDPTVPCPTTTTQPPPLIIYKESTLSLGKPYFY